jgi:multisite-specific tRNA:(cytosine-C5)-methyltransferase
MVLPLWRHPGSANLMVDKDDRKAMLLRLFNEKDTEIINHVAEKAKAEQKKLDEEMADAEEAADVSDGEGVNEQDIVEEEEGGAVVDMDGDA